MTFFSAKSASNIASWKLDVSNSEFSITKDMTEKQSISLENIIKKMKGMFVCQVTKCSSSVWCLDWKPCLNMCNKLFLWETNNPFFALT